MLTLLFLLAELQTICQTYWNKIKDLEGDKFDLEWIEKLKEFEVSSYYTRYTSLLSYISISCRIADIVMNMHTQSINNLYRESIGKPVLI